MQTQDLLKTAKACLKDIRDYQPSFPAETELSLEDKLTHFK